MWWATLKWVIFGMALAMLSGNFCKAAPSPRNDDMFRELIKLDQLYSSIARPRFGKRGGRNEIPIRNNNQEDYENNHVQIPSEDAGSDPDWLPLRR